MSWKKAVLVALVVLLVVIGLPIMMPGMGAATCHECGPVVTTGTACTLVAVLVGFAFVFALLFLWIRARRDLFADLLRAVVFDRPPRLA